MYYIEFSTYCIEISTYYLDFSTKYMEKAARRSGGFGKVRGSFCNLRGVSATVWTKRRKGRQKPPMELATMMVSTTAVMAAYSQSRSYTKSTNESNTRTMGVSNSATTPS